MDLPEGGTPHTPHTPHTPPAHPTILPIRLRPPSEANAPPPSRRGINRFIYVNNDGEIILCVDVGGALSLLYTYIISQKKKLEPLITPDVCAIQLTS